jgi:glucose-1-phosphate cytidylyltransferase
MADRPPLVILCGGRGTRLRAHTEEIPKPLVEIGDRPIVWHVIRLYAAQGFDRFVLASGYRGELIERFAAQERWPAGVRVEVLETGDETNTGGRVLAAGRHLAGEQRLCVTYSDGLADVALDELLRFHAGHGGPATVTVVRPRLQFGVARLDEQDRVLAFEEKPRSEHWINGGFFCFQREFLDRLSPDSVLEREPLQRLAAAGELRAFRHRGFWQCMDTLKDALALNELWDSGEAPWRLWEQDEGPAEEQQRAHGPAQGSGATGPPLVAS